MYGIRLIKENAETTDVLLMAESLQEFILFLLRRWWGIDGGGGSLLRVTINCSGSTGLGRKLEAISYPADSFSSGDAGVNTGGRPWILFVIYG